MKALKWLNKNFEEFIMVSFLMIMTLIMGIQICARYLFNNSMAWTEEITRYLFVWSGFLSNSFCMTKGIAIRLEQVTSKLKPKMHAAANIIVHMSELIFFAYLIPFSWSYMMKAVESGQLSTACEMPMYIVQAAPFVCFVLVCLRAVQQIWGEIQMIRGKEA